jgi:hypothetical protein
MRLRLAQTDPYLFENIKDLQHYHISTYRRRFHAKLADILISPHINFLFLANHTLMHLLSISASFHVFFPYFR